MHGWIDGWKQNDSNRVSGRDYIVYLRRRVVCSFFFCAFGKGRYLEEHHS